MTALRVLAAVTVGIVVFVAGARRVMASTATADRTDPTLAAFMARNGLVDADYYTPLGAPDWTASACDQIVSADGRRTAPDDETAQPFARRSDQPSALTTSHQAVLDTARAVRDTFADPAASHCDIDDVIRNLIAAVNELDHGPDDSPNRADGSPTVSATSPDSAPPG